jgi:hypothetical protein
MDIKHQRNRPDAESAVREPEKPAPVRDGKCGFCDRLDQILKNLSEASIRPPFSSS